MLGRRRGQPTMTEVDERLPRHVRTRRGRRTLVVIAASEVEVAGLHLAQSPWAGARVVPLVGCTDDDLHRELAALSDVGLVIDVRRSSDDHLGSFERLFFHLDPMGVWVTFPGPRLPWRREPLVGLVRRLQDRRARQGLEAR